MVLTLSHGRLHLGFPRRGPRPGQITPGAPAAADRDSAAVGHVAGLAPAGEGTIGPRHASGPGPASLPPSSPARRSPVPAAPGRAPHAHQPPARAGRPARLHAPAPPVPRRTRQPRPGALSPVRPRSWWAGTRFRWSGPARQPSPEPCAQVRILPGTLVKGINPNTLTIVGRSEARPVTCGNAPAFRILRPAGAWKGRCSAVFGDNGRPAVAVTADRCSFQYPQPRSGSTSSTGHRPGAAVQPADRLEATWLTSHIPS
jgi:hypothetical protein